LYGRSASIVESVNQAIQAQNIFFDQEDIKRHGMRPAIMTSNFDFPIKEGNNEQQSKKWSLLLFDMLNAGHLRESGSMTCYGITEPISVGDNLQFDGAIYHIETVSHHMAIDPGSGKKTFRTSLTLSFGTDLTSNKTTPVYPQMSKTNTLSERNRGNNNEKDLYTGYSDSQHLPRAENAGTRVNGEDVRDAEQLKASEGSFTRAPVNKSGKNRASSPVFDNKSFYKPTANGSKKETKK
jgi:hypothetical protein